jgi:cell division protein FtsA
MEGVVELAEEIFHMPVRLGAPQNITGLSDIVNNPIYSTGVGLLQYALKQHLGDNHATPAKDSELGLLAKLKRMFQGEF